MRFGRKRSERHGRRDESLHDRCSWLHLRERHWGAAPELEQVPRVQRSAFLHLGHEFLELGVAGDGVGLSGLRGLASADRLLQRGDHRRRPSMLLAILAEADAAVVGNAQWFAGLGMTIGQPVTDKRVLRELVEPDSPDHGVGTPEAALHHLLAQAEALEDLGAVVGWQDRDTHLRHDLQQALLRGGAISAARLLG
jgi:hypothetical protein